MVDRIQKLTRDEIAQFAKSQRQIRFFEELQVKNSETVDDLAVIYSSLNDLGQEIASLMAEVYTQDSGQEVFVGASLPLVFRPAVGFEEIGGYPSLYLMKVND